MKTQKKFNAKDVEWARISKVTDGVIRDRLIAQQGVFRLFQALRVGNLDLVSELVESGTSIDSPLILEESPQSVPRAEQFKFLELDGLNSLTPLGYVAGLGKFELTKWLLDNDASPSAPFGNGRDAAWVAMELNKQDTFDLLLDFGVNPNRQLMQTNGTTRLIRAVQLSNVGIVGSLLGKRVKLEMYDNKGRTALHYNLAKNPYSLEDAEIGRMLLSAGSNPLVEDLDGATPSDYAHDDEQFMMLRNYGMEKEFDNKGITMENDNFVPEPIKELSPDDPGMPQLQKVPVFKHPRF